MEQKILLKHPAGKKAISMDKEKYTILEKSILKCLRLQVEVSHKDILNAIREDFKIGKINFTGSVEWYMEWVKLDMEARKIIARIAGTTPIKFKLA